mmetsp:Transcript_31846/g.101321  ORF Transcript_31846/g.101321 Transcript_31846/m.101321 type:complete len:368 (+) Transcript_31846:68-1171(+)
MADFEGGAEAAGVAARGLRRARRRRVRRHHRGHRPHGLHHERPALAHEHEGAPRGPQRLLRRRLRVAVAERALPRVLEDGAGGRALDARRQPRLQRRPRAQVHHGLRRAREDPGAHARGTVPAVQADLWVVRGEGRQGAEGAVDAAGGHRVVAHGHVRETPLPHLHHLRRPVQGGRPLHVGGQGRDEHAHGSALRRIQPRREHAVLRGPRHGAAPRRRLPAAPRHRDGARAAAVHELHRAVRPQPLPLPRVGPRRPARVLLAALRRQRRHLHAQLRRAGGHDQRGRRGLGHQGEVRGQGVRRQGAALRRGRPELLPRREGAAHGPRGALHLHLGPPHPRRLRRQRPDHRAHARGAPQPRHLHCLPRQ